MENKDKENKSRIYELKQNLELISEQENNHKLELVKLKNIELEKEKQIKNLTETKNNLQTELKVYNEKYNTLETACHNCNEQNQSLTLSFKRSIAKINQIKYDLNKSILTKGFASKYSFIIDKKNTEFCKNCGYPTKKTQKFCEQCGEKTN